MPWSASPMKDCRRAQHASMTDDDLKAIAAYLKTLAPSASASSFKADDRTAKDLAPAKPTVAARNCMSTIALHAQNQRPGRRPDVPRTRRKIRRFLPRTRLR